MNKCPATPGRPGGERRWSRPGARCVGALGLALVCTALAAAEPLQVLLPGDFHGDEVTVTGAGDWLALVATAGQAALVPARVSVQPVFDALIDDTDAAPWTGKRVLSGLSEPVRVLLRGSGLSAGALLAAAVEGEFAGLGDKTLHWDGAAYTLALEDCAAPAGCGWTLRGPAGAQVIARFNAAVRTQGSALDLPPQTGLIWAGDLDRDGRLDLIVDASDHYNAVASVRVLLSGRAAGGALLGEAARFDAVGC